MPGFANKQEFLACLDDKATPYGLEIFAQAKRHLPAAVEEVGFDDFSGHDYEAMDRFRERLIGKQSEPALWGLVAVDLWFCSNFGGGHWRGLIERDNANVRFAIQAAYWVFAASGSNGAPTLAGLIKRGRCWNAAETYIRGETNKRLRAWWRQTVLPWR